MKKGYFILLLTFVLFSFGTYAHEDEDIIIDTDGSIDDLRAICALVSLDEAHILAILTSDGSLAPAECGLKVTGLLNSLQILDIPVGIGEELTMSPPDWRPFSQAIVWGNEDNESLIYPQDAAALLANSLVAADEPVTLFCLGPLTNVDKVLKAAPQLSKKIERIIWYNETIRFPGGFNYERDSSAARFVLTSSTVRVEVISNLNKPGMEFSSELLTEISKIPNTITSYMVSVHEQPLVQERMISGHLKLWDDLLPIYFLFPDAFDMHQVADYPTIRINTDFDAPSIKEKLVHIFHHDYAFSSEVIFMPFPTDTNMFTPDVRAVLQEIILRYGNEEWRKCVLTNEIHGHLGTYSILVAKMGVKAREVLFAEVDRITVISNAGDKPPLSCLNDGLQMSTGATLGLGMISISEDSIKSPSAEFSYHGKQIKLVLKPEIQRQVKSEINQAISKHGMLTPAYWEAIRAISIKHWLEFDRNEIFDIIVL
ncbi:MAG: nucleoside hydrolase [Bacteroidales bacterium]|jgi:pyrimidine-specific ribonucleoside hydrolase